MRHRHYRQQQHAAADAAASFQLSQQRYAAYSSPAVWNTMARQSYMSTSDPGPWVLSMVGQFRCGAAPLLSHFEYTPFSRRLLPALCTNKMSSIKPDVGLLLACSAVREGSSYGQRSYAQKLVIVGYAYVAPNMLKVRQTTKHGETRIYLKHELMTQ